MVSPPEEGILKEERDAEDKIIISDSTLREILPPQLKEMTAQYKLIYACKCYIYAKTIHLSFLTCFYYHLKQLKYIGNNS